MLRWCDVKLALVCITVALANNFQYGFSSTYFNTPVISFKQYLNQSITARGHPFTEATYQWMWNLLLNIWFIGFFFGIWLSPILNDRYGRKAGFIFGTALSLLASILRLVAVHFHLPELLFIGRVVISITAAVMYQALILYLQECPPTKLRGMMSFTSEITYSSMCVLGLVLGTDQMFGLNLDYLLGFAIIPSAIAVLVVLPIPETPKFLLISKNDRKAAIRSIRFFHGEDVNVDDVIFEIEKESEEKSSSSLQEICTTPYLRKAAITGCLALQNTVALWALLLSSTYFLRTVNLEDNLAAWSSTAMGATYVMGASTGFVIVERLPRRCLILSFSSCGALCLVLFVLCAKLQPVLDWTKYVCLVSLLVFSFIYGAGIGPPSWILCTELVPHRHRSVMQSLCYSINTVMVVASTFIVLPLYAKIGAYAFLILYSVPSIVSIIYLYRNLPETKGREIHAIVADLRGSTDDESSQQTTSDVSTISESIKEST